MKAQETPLFWLSDSQMDNDFSNSSAIKPKKSLQLKKVLSELTKLKGVSGAVAAVGKFKDQN